MAKINELVEQVVRKETQAYQEKVEAKRAETKQALTDKQQALQADLVAEKSKVDEQLNTRYQITHQSQKIAHRDQLLREKQTLLNKVFSLAEDQLNNLSAEDFKAFVTDVLTQFKGQGVLMVKLGEHSQGLLDQGWLDSVAIEGINVQLSEELVPQNGGFILEKSGIQYNFLSDTLIQDAKQRLTVEISKLFNQ
ncbi:hypothetical protein ACTQ45_10690 [Fundicoccus sp. Sow4_D5]|uniref:hypothetical protein n=1 Tax=Fundicoccus sp. Sow4_D5 TaxID=3438782 RepID=UPI003F911DB6